MPPVWFPFAALAVIILMSVWRTLAVARLYNVRAFSFGKFPHIQSFAQRVWKVAVAAALAFALLAWLAPHWSQVLGAPVWADQPLLAWTGATIMSLSAGLIFVAQIQMGPSWRVGVPEEGPGALVAHGLYRWSRNPIFVGMIGALVGLFLSAPHIGTGALLTGTWIVAAIQVRLEEDALRDAHGEAYERYARIVGRWFGRRGTAS
ncbi:MAG: isoprenylcysteine carboxylmethyltransferase family protein [Hyphomonadaceae bacterium]|nr:isoprenylcysteine carboxylmethyltransferase family protein [Hyphomonadaceae bacterium]